MPTKRDLIGLDGPADGLSWSDVRWDRVLAFFGGLGLLLLFLLLGDGAARHFPNWLAAGLAAIPAGLLVYGATEQSPRDAAVNTVGIGVLAALAHHPDAAGLVPLV